MMPVHNNNNHMVEGSVERGRAVPVGARPERYDKSMAVAAIVQSIPWFIWAAPVVIIFGFIIMALLLNHDSHSLKSFIGSVTFWFSMVPIVGGVGLAIYGLRWGYRFYHQYILDASNRRLVKATEQKAVASARNAELKNDLLQADIDLRQQIPQVILALTQTGVAFKYDAKGTLEVLGQAGRVGVNQVTGVQEVGAGAQAAIAGPADDLPDQVMYEDVRYKVPVGHVLVGIGKRGLIETVQWAVGACIWICGLSGTGKTSTTMLRVEERHVAGHAFLGVDPHFFKRDSFTNAVKGYLGSFIRPIARTPEETSEVLNLFLSTFLGRKSGQIKPNEEGQWPALTLIVDEVGSLMDATEPLEQENAALLKRIARICGQEARDFQMGGIFISQQATGLAWLRKVALMVIVHQLLMTSEKELACNGDKGVMKDMEHWPRGRTYVYGVGFGADGARTVQQPYFASPGRSAPAGGADPVVDLVEEENDLVEDERVIAASAVTQKVEVPEEEKSDLPSPVPALTGDLRKVYDAVQYMLEVGGGFNAREIAQVTGFGKDKANGLLNRLVDLGYIQRRKAV